MERVMREMKEDNKKYQMEMTMRMNPVEKMLQTNDAIFVWPIDDVEQKKTRGGSIMSEYFCGRMQPYKMRLSLFPNSSRVAYNLAIYLRIYSSSNDADLEWPFVCDVSIKIVNKASPDAHKIITNHQTISKPQNNLYSYDSNNCFYFSYLDLSSAGLLQGNNFIMQCFINHK